MAWERQPRRTSRSTVNQAPAITSANSTTFTVGTAGSFTVTATGTPTPTLTETGALPSGVTFVNNGNGTATLSGTPAAGTGGSYSITITASNGVGTTATQSLTSDGESGAGDHQRQQHDVHGGHGRKLHGDGDRDTDAVADRDGRAAERRDVREQREWDGDLSGTPAAGTGGSLRDHDHGEQWRGHGCHAELHADGESGAGDHERE